jgi:hypothetical protein
MLAQVRVAVDPEAAAERKGDSAEPVRLEITFPDTYPDVAPNIVVQYSHILPKHAQASRALPLCMLPLEPCTGCSEWMR